MEIFELRYFLAVAEQENIHRASKKQRVSPPSLSKAIARLEEELGVKLFRREGRGIRLSDHGKLLQRKASEIVQLEESARIEVGGHHGTLQVTLSGPEILLSKMGLSVSQTLKKKYPASRFEFIGTSDEEAMDQVSRGAVHLAMVTADVSPKRGLSVRFLEKVKFQTYVGEGHPLYKAAREGRTVNVGEVLKHSFVSPSHPLLGQVGLKQSLDGWRDDQFPRKLEYLASSLKLLEEIVVSGRAIAYLPDYFCEKLKVSALKISGCPYSCIQEVKLLARNPKDIGWMSLFF